MDKFSYSLPGEVVVRDGQVTDEWKEEDHPRVPPGSPGGGQFTSGGGGEQTYPQHTKEGKGAWKGSPVPKDVWPQNIAPVGRYALHFQWSDGHGSGIYTFEHLRKLAGL